MENEDTDEIEETVSWTEIKNAEERFRGLIDKRNELNEEGRFFQKERDSLNEQKKKVRETLDDNVKMRDELVKKSKEHKKKRNSYQKQAKELIAFKNEKRDLLVDDLQTKVNEIRNDIMEMEYRQQTTPLKLDDEKELIDTIKKRQIELNEKTALLAEQDSIAQEISSLDEKIDELFSKADGEHEMVVEYSKESQVYHDKIKDIYDKLNELSRESDEWHKKFIGVREKADYYHKRAMEMKDEVLGMKRSRNQERKKRMEALLEQNRTVEQELYDKEKLKEKEDESLRKLREDGKINI